MKISCKEASRLSSQSLERTLSWWERVKLRFHNRLCGWCGGHDSDMQAVHKACRCAGGDSPTEELSAEAKQRILAIIRAELANDERKQADRP